MRDDKRKGLGLGPSRRRFLQQAGLAAAGVTALAVPGKTLTAADKRRIEAAGPAGDCACDPEAALPLRAAVLLNGAYLGLAASDSGPRLFSLDVDGTGRVTLGSPLELGIPEDFVFGSLGLAHGRLVLTGGLPFPWASYEVDDEMSGDVLAAIDLETFPADVPRSGTRTIEVTGTRPAAFFLNPPYAEALAMPAMPDRAFGVAGSVAETRNGLALLIEHCDGRNESFYAAAVDVIEEQFGSWNVRPAGRDLGESGPNHLAAAGADLVVALTTSEGVSFVWPARSLAQPAPTGVSRVLGVFPGDGRLAVIGTDGSGVARTWSLSDGTNWTPSDAVQLDGDEVVLAVPVAGVRGQSILVGHRTARLVDVSSVLTGRARGRDNHVV
jgi:hypothetical protein